MGIYFLTFLSIFRAFSSLSVPHRFSLITFSLANILKFKTIGFEFSICEEYDVQCGFKSS